MERIKSPSLQRISRSIDSQQVDDDDEEFDDDISSTTGRPKLSNPFLLVFVTFLYFLQGLACLFFFFFFQHLFLIFLLSFSLFLQPMGLISSSIPLLLKGSSSFTQIGVFSFVLYPYSLKLLWSPFVDVLWWQPLGRRKSWIIPSQIFAGLVLSVCLFFLFFSSFIFLFLTFFFFFFFFYCSSFFKKKDV